MLVDEEIQITFESPRPITHFHAPDHKLEIDRALAKFFEEYAWGWVFQRCGRFAGRSDQRIPDFIDIASVGDAHRDAKSHSWIAISPVRDWRVDEHRVRHD